MSGERPLDRFDHIILDLDGVVYLRDRPIPSTVSFLKAARDEGKRILFLTNNSMFGVEHYRRKLSAMGVEANRGEILTSAMVLRETLEARKELCGSTVMVIGGRALEKEMERACMRPLRGEEGRKADLVVVGWDTRLTYRKLKNACLAVNAGADFYATNDDATYPAPDGRWPGAGSIVAALQRATGKDPVIVGKPHLPMMEAALRRLDCPVSRALMVGDRLDTDVAGGARVGLPTCLVLTGISTRSDLEKGDVRPDLVVDELTELLEGKDEG